MKNLVGIGIGILAGLGLAGLLKEHKQRKEDAEGRLYDLRADVEDLKRKMRREQKGDI